MKETCSLGLMTSPKKKYPQFNDYSEPNILDDKDYEEHDPIMGPMDYSIGPHRAMDYEKIIKKALTYFSPFVEKEYGTGYDGIHQINKNERTYFPLNRHIDFDEDEEKTYPEERPKYR